MNQLEYLEEANPKDPDIILSGTGKRYHNLKKVLDEKNIEYKEEQYAEIAGTIKILVKREEGLDFTYNNQEVKDALEILFPDIDWNDELQLFD